MSLLSKKRQTNCVTRRKFLGVTMSAPAALTLPSMATVASCAPANTNGPPDGKPPGSPRAAPKANPHGFPDETRDQKAIWEVYGDPLDNTNIVRVASPFPLRLDWDLSSSRKHLWAHRLVADSLATVMHETVELMGVDAIRHHGIDQFTGDHVDRAMRGANRHSLHSWGIAFDFFGSQNLFRWDHRNARFARPEYREWFKLWEAEGWYSLGRERDFDWMHFQAASRLY